MYNNVVDIMFQNRSNFVLWSNAIHTECSQNLKNVTDMVTRTRSE